MLRGYFLYVMWYAQHWGFKEEALSPSACKPSANGPVLGLDRQQWQPTTVVLRLASQVAQW